MNAFLAAFWAEALKARRSRITLLTAAGFLLLPLAGGLFMLILKNPAQAQAWGLISTKAQLTVGVADWPSYFSMLLQGIAMGGAILFALITSWVFGREFSDHTAKELMALPTSRAAIVSAKFVLLGLWTMALTLLVVVVGLGVGKAVDIPGWSSELGWTSIRSIVSIAFFTFLLTPFVALVASWGRGYLPPMGWTILSLVFANIAVLLGWGDWFPWAIPVMVSGMVKSQAGAAGLHSYVVIILAFIAGLAATVAWWQRADQVR
jgi:ABC-2 type transport system permease protein